MLFFGNQLNGKIRVKSKEEEIRYKKGKYRHQQLVILRSDQRVEKEDGGQHFQEADGYKSHAGFFGIPSMNQQHKEVARKGKQAQKHIDLPQGQVKVKIPGKIQLQEIV